MSKYYKRKTKMDLFHSVLINGTLVAIIVMGLLIGYLNANLVMYMYAAVPMFLFLAYVEINTTYTLKEDHMYITFGIVRTEIKYVDIEEISRAKSFKSSAGFSSDRIKIKTDNWICNKGVTFISPVDIDEFYIKLEEKIKEAKKK